MGLNEDKLAELLEDADELLSRYMPTEIEPTWNRNLETLGLYAVINQLWQNPRDTVGVYVQAIKPVVLAAWEMGRQAERGEK